MLVNAYLDFDGRCDEAIAFYQKALGATVETLMRYKDLPPGAGGEGCPGPMPPADKVMHASFKIGGTSVMATDGQSQGKPSFQGISLTLTVRTVEEADRVWAALAEGGQVQMPLGETFFSSRFGMLADRFGLSWMVVVMR